MRFRVNGLPAPQGSKRHVGHGRMVESSRAVGPWREAVRAEAQLAMSARDLRGTIRWIAGDPLSVTVVFVFPRPKSHYTRPGLFSKLGAAVKYPAKRPDLDKLLRAVLDGLVAGGVMADDAQVCEVSSAKIYAARDEAVGAIIEVEAL